MTYWIQGASKPGVLSGKAEIRAVRRYIKHPIANPNLVEAFKKADREDDEAFKKWMKALDRMTYFMAMANTQDGRSEEEKKANVDRALRAAQDAKRDYAPFHQSLDAAIDAILVHLFEIRDGPRSSAKKRKASHPLEDPRKAPPPPASMRPASKQ